MSSKETQWIVSLPVRMEKSDFHPFGDPQVNAKMSFGSLAVVNEFPAVGFQKTSASNKLERTYLFHSTLKITEYQETALNGGWYKIKPKGWEDSFYFRFDVSILRIQDFLQGVPVKYRSFSDGRVAPDMEKIGKGQGMDRFIDKTFGPGYLGPFEKDNVHAWFPDEKGKRYAVGGVTTWGINLDPSKPREFGAFKQLYTCFDSRNEKLENELGVPSGAGWHYVGDPAETILNNLVPQALPVAIARSHHFSDASYQFNEVITATWLQSDEVFVTRRDEFHWYLNPYEEPVCTEIWVQNPVPDLNNSWGFKY